MIRIRPSPTADTRTCDWSKVDRKTLLNSSLQHIGDVHNGIEFFVRAMYDAAARHDRDKVTEIDHFLADFQTGFKETGWWDNHRKVNRHHLTEADGIPEDVNLVDVLDHIVDCVMAGMARSGSVRPLALPSEILQRAFQNTVALLQANVELEPAPSPSPGAETPAEQEARHRRGGHEIHEREAEQEAPKCSRCGGSNLDMDVGAGRWFCLDCLAKTGNGATSPAAAPSGNGGAR